MSGGPAPADADGDAVRVDGDDRHGMSGGPAPADSFRAFLPGLGRLMPPSLLGAAGCERLLDRTGDLPGFATAAHFGLEFRLDEAAAVADIAVPVEPGTELADHFVRVGEAAAPRSPAAALARRLRRTDGFGPVFEDHAILEYDVASAKAGTRVPPGVFLKPRSASGPDTDPSPGRVADALAALAGREPHRDERRSVERAFAMLPDEARMAQAGVLPARTPGAIRLVVRDAQAAGIADYLTRMGHPDPAAAQTRVPSALRDLCDPRPWLGVDVSARGMSPRIGLELWPPEDGQDRGPGRWMRIAALRWWPVIDVLEQTGLCLPRKARGLRRWPGKETVFRGRRALLLYRGINHIKIVIDGAAVHAKAYVGVTCAPVSGGSGGPRR